MSLLADLTDADLDPRLGPVLRERLPGLTTALDGTSMAAHVQRALEPSAPVDGVVVGPASYVGDACVVRYDVEVDGRSWVVTGRVFPDEAAATTYVSERLDPLAAQARGRTELGCFAQPAGAVPELGVALSVFPVDGGLPTLVAATDPAGMLGPLQAAVPRTLGGRLAVTSCDVELGHYGRQHRCVLRYRLGVTRSGRRARPVVVYGKLAADDRGAAVPPVVAALRAVSDGVVAVPRALDYLPDLRLGLFEALPGSPRIAQLLRARLDGVPAQSRRPPTLDAAVDACARIAALLHTSGIRLGPERPFEADTSALRRGVDMVRAVAPRLAGALEARLADAESRRAGDAPERVLSHGDFSYTQLIFDGNRPGLVDFDTICRAEPALDLGHFLAYLDLAAGKAARSDPAAVRGLQDRFLATYADATGLAEPGSLRERVEVYETLSLLRLAVHSWQKLKPKRLRLVLDALEARPGAPLPGRA